MAHSDYNPTSDWLDALQVVVQAGRKEVIPRLFAHVDLELSSNVLPAVVCTIQGDRIKAVLDIGIADLPCVERVEILCYTAAHSLRLLNRLSPEEELLLCTQLGCACSTAGTISERWRLIGFELDPRQKDGPRQASLVSRLFEDRPSCGWCNTPLATGTKGILRPDLHSACHDYILRVVRPQMLAARKAEQDAIAKSKIMETLT